MNLNSVETKITVDGKPCDFIYMNLDQYVAGHHTFEIAVSYRYEKQSVWAITVDDIFRETLSKPVFIRMAHIDTGECTEFEGVVTDIEVVGIDGDKGTVILSGGSPTILLDRDPSMAAFVDYTLYNVVAETLENTGIKIDVQNNPKTQRIIPYIARYKESSYAFLSRVLCSFGEWFYYDGKKLIVGNPMNQQERRVTYDVELLEVRSAAGLRNLNTRYYDYNSAANDYFEEDSTTISNANLPMKGAKMVAEPLYPTPAKLPVGRAVLGEQDMSAIVRVKQSREYTKTSVFTAKCETCSVKIGEVATVLLPKSKDVRFIDLGSFRVLEVHHQVNKEGHYENTFKGIAALTETLPDDHIVAPQAFPEPAIVVDNNDPNGQGRIKVRYLWQPQDASTNWMQVQTPDAGSSDAVAKNRGFVFIPEIDDQVMIGFQYGDPGRPYVMGSLFHRDISKGAAENNSVKSITTRSGIIIEANDDNGSLHVEVPSGSTLDMDGNGNIKVNAIETMTFIAKNMQMDVEEDLTINVNNNVTQTVGKNISLSVSENSSVSTGKRMLVSAKQNINIKTSAGLETEAMKDITTNTYGNISIKTSAGEMQLASKGELFLKSETNVNNAN